MELQSIPMNSFIPLATVTPPPAVAPKPEVGSRLAEQEPTQSSRSEDDQAENPRNGRRSETELSQEEQRKVEELRQRDIEVRTHEQAHVAAGGRYVTRAATYDYELGPDGRRYAVGGEVKIDISKVSGDPQATIEKARVIQSAALAPAQPSPQDRQVAAAAAAMENEARAELREQRMEELRESSPSADSDADAESPMAVSAPSVAEPPDPPQSQTSTLSMAVALEQRIANFFADPVGSGLSVFA